MKTIFALLLGIAVYFTLGHTVSFTNSTALVITLLGSWGALTYKGIVALAVFGAVAKS